MSKYISRTKSKIIFRENAEKEIGEKIAPTSNKILADIMRRREEFNKRQIERAHEREKMVKEIHKPVEHPQVLVMDEFEKEYEAFIAEQKRIKAERELKEAEEKKHFEVPVIQFTEIETPVKEVNNEVVSEADTTSENSEEIQVVETKPKKRRKKKKVVETTETVE